MPHKDYADRLFQQTRRRHEARKTASNANDERNTKAFQVLYLDNPELAIRVWTVRFMLEQRHISIQELAAEYLGKHGRWYVYSSLAPYNYRPDGAIKPKDNNNSIPWAIVHKRLDEIEHAITLWTIDNPGSIVYGSKEARDEMRYQLDGPSEIKEMFPDGRRG